MSHDFLQHYWWIIISLVGAIFVFLMFVQGGQTLIYTLGKTDVERSIIINTLGRKWEFTFTTLVLFGGALFAAFPLFYSVSFGGAYWVWMLILFSFVVQAVSYEYRSKPSNFLGKRIFEIFLIFNGVVGTFVVGVAVGTFYNGANFILNDFNQSQWVSGWYGLKALFDLHNLSLGIALFFLARIQALLYFMRNIDEKSILRRCVKQMKLNSVIFLVAFLSFLIFLMLKPGYSFYPDSHQVWIEPYKYVHNLIHMPIIFDMLIVGVVLVLISLYQGVFRPSTRAIWFSGLGTVMTIWSVLMIAGLNNTCFYPSIADIQSSLSIANASSSLFTLKTMFFVSFLVPFVLAYIWYAWRAINDKPMTEEELDSDAHIY